MADLGEYLFVLFPGMLDMLQIETPDGKFPLIQLGQIVQKNPQLVVVNLTSTPQVTI